MRMDFFVFLEWLISCYAVREPWHLKQDIPSMPTKLIALLVLLSMTLIISQLDLSTGIWQNQ